MKNNPRIYIAIADDHPIIRQGLINLLKEFGIVTVAEGNNGVELIENIEQASNLPHICFLDIMMPKMDGYETIKILNEKWPTIKTLVFTMFYNEYSLVRMISNGAKGYLLKGCSIEEICTAIHEIQEVGFYYSELETKTLSNNTNELEKYFFTENELRFIEFCCSELTYKELASKMNVSLGTVDTYRKELFSKLNLKSRVGLVMFAIKAGIVPLMA